MSKSPEELARKYVDNVFWELATPEPETSFINMFLAGYKAAQDEECCSYCKGMVDGIKSEIEHQSGGWIATSVQLPDMQQEVILYAQIDKDEPFQVCHGWRDLGWSVNHPDRWLCYERDGDGHYLEYHKVTHWRPMPEPPKGDDDE